MLAVLRSLPSIGVRGLSLQVPVTDSYYLQLDETGLFVHSQWNAIAAIPKIRYASINPDFELLLNVTSLAEDQRLTFPSEPISYRVRFEGYNGDRICLGKSNTIQKSNQGLLFDLDETRELRYNFQFPRVDGIKEEGRLEFEFRFSFLFGAGGLHREFILNSSSRVILGLKD